MRTFSFWAEKNFFFASVPPANIKLFPGRTDTADKAMSVAVNSDFLKPRVLVPYKCSEFNRGRKDVQERPPGQMKARRILRVHHSESDGKHVIRLVWRTRRVLFSRKCCKHRLSYVLKFNPRQFWNIAKVKRLSLVLNVQTVNSTLIVFLVVCWTMYSPCPFLSLSIL